MMTMTILPRRIRRLAGAATCATLLAAATVPLAAGSASAAPVGSSPTTAAAPAAPSPLPDGAAPRQRPPDRGGVTGGRAAPPGRARRPRRRGAGDRGSRRRARGPLATDGRSAGLADLLAHPLGR